MTMSAFLPERSSSRAGFTLVEIVLSVGIISVAVVAILGLFPVALDAATKSQQETQAALIARSIYNELSSKSDPTRFVVTKTEDDVMEREDIDLTKAKTYFSSYDNDGRPAGTLTSEAYDAGTSKPSYLARITVTPLGVPPSTQQDQVGLSQVTLSVETPAAAPKERRKAYIFAGLIRQGHERSTTSTP